MVITPASDAWDKKRARHAFRQRLGEWADETVDSEGRWQQPVLSSKAFEDHFTKILGLFKPSGELSSSFAWAQLLYALDIRPGAKVLEWKPLHHEIDPVESGQLPLVIDGEALCHIINLYQTYTEPRPRKISGAEGKAQTSFGRLALRDGPDSSSIVTFEPAELSKLSATRKLFQASHRLWRHNSFPSFDESIVAARYLNAIYYGASEESLMLPHPKEKLADRCKGLCSSIEVLVEWDNHLYLLTPKWIREANRIKQRATTDGGEDRSLAEVAIQYLSRQPSIVDDDLEEAAGSDPWQKHVRYFIEGMCMFKSGSFDFEWDAEHKTPRRPHAVHSVVRRMGCQSYSRSCTTHRPGHGMVHSLKWFTNWSRP
ncbi:hypothetical protein QBC44DRAFT_320930 [Cladorrhinum sp. PSN332]|nr:hypothetical protein QBC44DRAFT_320930 [Cladorrhinum sp. PSN332]